MKRIDFENGNTTSNLLNDADCSIISTVIQHCRPHLYRSYSRYWDYRPWGCRSMLSDYCNNHRLCQSAWHRWRTDFLNLPREKRCRTRQTNHGNFFHAALRLFFDPDACRHAPCKSSSRIIRCLQRCAKICLSISDDLSDWNTSIHDHYRDESIYQRSGICCCRYVFRYNRSCCKHYFRPNFYLCISLRCSGSRNCNRHLSGCICRICALFSKTPRRDQSPAFFAPQNALLHC